MKKSILLFLILPILLSCSNSGFNNNNPYIPNYSFSVEINTNFGSFSNLNFVSNAIYYNGPGVGAKGIFVFNTGTGFNAFDAACPNQAINSCGVMSINGINVKCPCDNQEYSLFTGQGKLQYPLKQYRTEVNGTIIRIYN